LNDNIIDLHARYYLNNTISKEQQAQVYFFSTIFLKKFRSDKENYALNSKWGEAKCVGLFSKHLIFFPINDSLHWSLITVVTPENLISRSLKRAIVLEQQNMLDELVNERYIDNFVTNDADVEYSCLLFTDSLGIHNFREFSGIMLRWKISFISPTCPFIAYSILLMGVYPF
jgi:Ulp1 family protease